MYKRMREWMMTIIEDEKYEETRSKAPTTVACYDSDGDLIPDLVENMDNINLEEKRYSKKKQPSSAAHKDDTNMEFNACKDASVILRMIHKPKKKLTQPLRFNMEGTKVNQYPRMKTTCVPFQKLRGSASVLKTY